MHLLVVILNNFIKSNSQEAKQSAISIVGCGSIWLLHAVEIAWSKNKKHNPTIGELVVLITAGVELTGEDTYYDMN